MSVFELVLGYPGHLGNLINLYKIFSRKCEWWCQPNVRVCVCCVPWCEGYYMDLLAKCCLMLLMLLKSLVQADRRRVAYCRINHKKGFSAGGTWGKDGAGANEDTHPDL